MADLKGSFIVDLQRPPRWDLSLCPASYLLRNINPSHVKVWVASVSSNINVDFQNFLSYMTLNKGIDGILSYTQEDFQGQRHVPLPKILRKAFQTLKEKEILLATVPEIFPIKEITPLVNHMESCDLICFETECGTLSPNVLLARKNPKVYQLLKQRENSPHTPLTTLLKQAKGLSYKIMPYAEYKTYFSHSHKYKNCWDVFQDQLDPALNLVGLC